MKRRQFITKASTVFAGVQFLPGHAWAESPNGKLNLIHIGVGEKGKMLLPHIGNPQFFDNDNVMQKVRLPKLDGINHYHQWADAAMGEGQASANFNYAGKLTESLLLGSVANRYPDEELLWDAENLKFTNKPEADKIIRRTYRKGFEVENL